MIWIGYYEDAYSKVAAIYSLRISAETTGRYATVARIQPADEDFSTIADPAHG